MRKLLPIFILVVCLFACEKASVGVLSRDKMKEVLFDYHLTQGMIDQMNSEQREESQRYIDAIFRKHGITEAEFDSSMVWYNRNGVLLKEIYEEIGKDYEELDHELKMQNGNTSILSSVTLGGDTTNIWTGNPLMIFRPNGLANKETFEINADSSFHRKDKFTLYANTAFIKELNDDRNSNLSMGIMIEYKDGKTVGTNRLIDYNSPVNMTVESSEDKDIKSIYGYFFYTGSTTSRNIAVVNGIALIRIHDKTIATPEPVPADTTAVDSTKSDTTVTVKRRPTRHLTPEEVRMQNQTEDRIQIKAAPDVRTKNSYGPRRNNARKKNSK